ncbi:Glucose/galactose transporter [Vanrija pseudolonga]|uniref:Glucose/galactose transporter n=1 Tax=Vanrija pseudolonga TaxID=143232 RepID=A0AAF1BKN2_9TREE|nr:Glucose/galactose transporter [Vanrija pseudolonga]
MAWIEPPTTVSQRPAIFFASTLLALCGLARGMFDVAAQHLASLSQADVLNAAFYAPFVLALVFGFVSSTPKRTAYAGLAFMTLGSGLLIVAAVVKSFSMACGFAAITSVGIAALELSANSLIATAPRPAANLALVNGVGSAARVLGSVVASKGVFVRGAFSATNAGYVAMGMAVLSLLLCIPVWGISLPPPKDDNEASDSSPNKWLPLVAFPVGFLALGAQASLRTHTTQFLAQSTGSVTSLPAYSAYDLALGASAIAAAATLAAWTYLRKMDACAALAMQAFVAAVFAVLIAVIKRTGGIVCLYLLYTAQGACFPLFFAVATAGVRNKSVAGGIVVASTSGGAVLPLLQRLLGAATTISKSFPLLVVGFIPLSLYAFVMWIQESKRTGGEMVAWHDEWNERPSTTAHQPEWQTLDVELVSRETTRA